MKRLRCLFGIDDELHAYAQRFLEAATFFSMNAPAAEMLDLGGPTVCKLQQDGEYQVELVSVPAGFYIPKHVHPNMDSIEVSISGAVRFILNDVDIFAHLDDARLLCRAKHRSLRINRTDVHHGKALATGAIFLSIQRWTGNPASAGTDYAGVSLSEKHEHLLS